MDRVLVAVEVQPIEGRFGDDPTRHLQHILVLDQKIHGGTQTRTDGMTQPIALVRGVLIALRIDAPGDRLRKRCGAEAVGQADHPEIIDDRIQDPRGQIAQRRVALGLLRAIGQSCCGLRLAAFDQLTVGEKTPARRVQVRDPPRTHQGAVLDRPALLLEQRIEGCRHRPIARHRQQPQRIQRLVERKLLRITVALLVDIA